MEKGRMTVSPVQDYVNRVDMEEILFLLLGPETET